MPARAGAGRAPQGPQKLFPPWACEDPEGSRGSCFFLLSLLGVHLQGKLWGSGEGCHSAVGEEPQKADREQGLGEPLSDGGGLSMDQIESQSSG